MESEVATLRKQNRALARQVEALRVALAEAERRGAASAWEEAETLLAELVMDHADESVVEASSQLLDPTGPPDTLRQAHLSRMRREGDGR